MGEPSTFSFSFNLGSGPATGGNAKKDEKQEAPNMPATEVTSIPAQAQLEDMEEVDVGEGIVLLKGRVASSQAAHLLGNDSVASSDLVSGRYEGGFKLWEGSIDLCKYMVTKYGLTRKGLFEDKESKTPLAGKRVLELGCGHGLPGILALLAGAEVHFQDYNKEVLTELTGPNVAANLKWLPPGRSPRGCRYFAGDWGSMGEMLTHKGFGGHYDIILTSESIYNIPSQLPLLECIKQVLQPPHGTVFVASKAYYFGVGGGVQSFTKAVKEDGIFEVNGVFRAEDKEGGNVREILELKFPISIVPYFL